MRVIQLVNIGHEAGGAERSVKLLQTELRSRGHDVLVVATDKQLDEHKVFADVVLSRPNKNIFDRAWRHSWNPRMSSELKGIIKSFKPDVIHLHTIGDFSPSVLWAVRDQSTLHTVHGPEEYTKALLHWHLPANDFKNCSYKVADLKVIGRLRLLYYRLLQRPLYLIGLHHLNLLVGPSKYMTKALGNDAGHVPTEHINNGIALPDAVDIGEAPRFLYAGRLEAVKGVDVLIRAMSKVVLQNPQAHLSIVGDGSARPTLESLTRDMNLGNNITFAGWANSSDLAEEYRACRVFVMPSIWPENMPTVVIEALAFGRPIIGTNVGGIPELVDPGVNGWIVEPMNIDALASAMIETLSDDVDLAAMGNASAIKAQQFDIETFINNIQHTYREIANAQ